MNHVSKLPFSDLELPDHLAYTSYPEALEGSDCDGVVVATWARTHDELVEAAIEADKHVMVEKPFTLQLAPAKRLTEMAEARGLKIVVTQQWRYLPGQRTGTTFDDGGGLWRAADRTHVLLQSPW